MLVVRACDPARGSGRTPSVQVCGVESASSASVSVPGTFRLFQNFSPVENFSHFFSSTQPQEVYEKKSTWPFSSMEELQQDLKQYCFHSEILLLPFSSPYPSSFSTPSPGTPGCHAGVRKRAPPTLIVDSFWPALELLSCCWKRVSHLLHPELRNSRVDLGQNPPLREAHCVVRSFRTGYHLPGFLSQCSSSVEWTG